MPAKQRDPDQGGLPLLDAVLDAASVGDFFAIFSLPFSFEIDLEQLEISYHDLLRQVHPDFFATASENEKQKVTQTATVCNEAYHTLKIPLSRAQHMVCLLQQGTPSAQLSEDASFLTQQMKIRQQIEKYYTSQQKKELLAQATHSQAQLAMLYQTFSAACTPKADLTVAQKTLYQIFFYENILSQIRRYLFELLDMDLLA